LQFFLLIFQTLNLFLYGIHNQEKDFHHKFVLFHSFILILFFIFSQFNDISYILFVILARFSKEKQKSQSSIHLIVIFHQKTKQSFQILFGYHGLFISVIPSTTSWANQRKLYYPSMKQRRKNTLSQKGQLFME